MSVLEMDENTDLTGMKKLERLRVWGFSESACAELRRLGCV